MKKLILKRKEKIISAIAMAILFAVFPIILDESINRFAPISWWVDIKKVQVTDIEAGTFYQGIEIHRKVHREINGKPRQELYLLKNGTKIELFSTVETDFLADYEVRESHIEYIPYDFWEKKGIVPALSELIEEGQEYQWVWVIEFIKPNGNSVIERYSSNTFKLSENVIFQNEPDTKSAN